MRARIAVVAVGLACLGQLFAWEDAQARKHHRASLYEPGYADGAALERVTGGKLCPNVEVGSVAY